MYTGLSQDKENDIVNQNQITIQTLLGYVFPLLPASSFYIHNLHLHLTISSGIYDQISTEKIQNKNNGKQWQHLILLAIRQCEGKSYRMFGDWLFEAYYLRLFLGLSRIPQFTTLQKFTDRINNSLLEKIISSFIVISGLLHNSLDTFFMRVKDYSFIIFL
jgi:hypothetical protein